MARRKSQSPKVQALHAYLEGVAKNLADKLYGPGRHGPGEYVFCYFVDPLGFICEYETDAIKIADPADYEFRVHKWSPESSDAWLGVLSGGMPDRFREVARNEPDAGWLAAAQS